MNPGRELDALIAEKVIGLPPFSDRVLKHLGPHVYKDHGNPTWSTYGKCVVCGRDDNTETCLPAYSSDIAMARTIIGRLKTQGWAWSAGSEGWKGGAHQYTFSFHKRDSDLVVSAVADTEPMAICLAALKAVGVSPAP